VESPEIDSSQVHRCRPNGAQHAVEPRLLSPSQAATYLGLGSRFAVYRLVTAGQLPAIRLANKLRLDVEDLNAMIENAKTDGVHTRTDAPRPPRSVPQRLAPRRERRWPVTVPVTASPSQS
jgi:excisionase family DNA binding protein